MNIILFLNIQKGFLRTQKISGWNLSILIIALYLFAPLFPLLASPPSFIYLFFCAVLGFMGEAKIGKEGEN